MVVDLRIYIKEYNFVARKIKKNMQDQTQIDKTCRSKSPENKKWEEKYVYRRKTKKTPNKTNKKNKIELMDEHTKSM